MIKKVELTPFDLPLKTPIPVPHGYLNRRTGTYLSLTLENDLTYRGEFSPLLGLSTNEEIIRMQNSFEDQTSKLLSETLDFSNINFFLPFFNVLNLKETSSFSTFCIESILLKIIKDKHPEKYNSIFTSNGGPIKYCQLLTSSKESLNTIDTKNIHYKIKIGRNPIEEELLFLETLEKRCESKPLIRLDANGSLKPNELTYLLNRLNGDILEFIEDPFSINELKSFKHSHLPFFALDVMDDNLINLEKNLFKQLKYLVIKPALIGGISKTLKLIDWAIIHNLKWAISSCFESPLGFSDLIPLCHYKNKANDTAHGLGTFSFFAQTEEFLKILKDPS